MALKVYRQGDVAFIPVNDVALERRIARAKARSRIIRRGENGGVHTLTGIKAKVVTVNTTPWMNSRGRMYLHTPKGAQVVHREHRTVTLPAGNYEVRVQRELQGSGQQRRARRVMD